MNESSFASLSPSLLARKGGAKPAMRPQAAILTGGAGAGMSAAHSLEDLGWNDMGAGDDDRHNADILQLTPAPANPEAEAEAHSNDEKAKAVLAEIPARKPAVHEQQAKIAEHLADQTAAPKAKASVPRKRRSALERGKKAAFTLRLDAERHLKLRLACTLRNRSAQQMVTDALDKMLGTMSDVNTLAAQARNSE